MARRIPAWVVSGISGIIVGAGLAMAIANDRPSDEPPTRAAVAPDSPTTTLPRMTTSASRLTTTTSTEPDYGTRSRPLPLGETAILQDDNGAPIWEIVVISYDQNATDRVMAENNAQDPPASGEQYAIVRVRATYRGDVEPAQLGRHVDFQAVDETNVAYDYNDVCLIYPERLDIFTDVYRNGTIEGNLCWSVTSATAPTLLLTLNRPVATGPPYFMAVS